MRKRSLFLFFLSCTKAGEEVKKKNLNISFLAFFYFLFDKENGMKRAGNFFLFSLLFCRLCRKRKWNKKEKNWVLLFPFLHRKWMEEALFLLSFSLFISFLEERGRKRKKRNLSFSLLLSSILSFWEGKEREWKGKKIYDYTLNYYNLKYNIFLFLFSLSFSFRDGISSFFCMGEKKNERKGEISFFFSFVSSLKLLNSSIHRQANQELTFFFKIDIPNQNFIIAVHTINIVKRLIQ